MRKSLLLIGAVGVAVLVAYLLFSGDDPDQAVTGADDSDVSRIVEADIEAPALADDDGGASRESVAVLTIDEPADAGPPESYSHWQVRRFPRFHIGDRTLASVYRWRFS